MVAAIASGEITPVWKTLSPSLVTSRSSCNVFNRCICTDAIFNRHEFDPISIAAKVGISPQYLTQQKFPTTSKIQRNAQLSVTEHVLHVEASNCIGHLSYKEPLHDDLFRPPRATGPP